MMLNDILGINNIATQTTVHNNFVVNHTTFNFMPNFSFQVSIS